MCVEYPIVSTCMLYYVCDSRVDSNGLASQAKQPSEARISKSTSFHKMVVLGSFVFLIMDASLCREDTCLVTRTTDTQWRHKSKISEKLGQFGRQNMLWLYLNIWDWDWIFGRAGNTISSLGVRSPWSKQCIPGIFAIICYPPINLKVKSEPWNWEQLEHYFQQSSGSTILTFTTVFWIFKLYTAWKLNSVMGFF